MRMSTIITPSWGKANLRSLRVTAQCATLRRSVRNFAQICAQFEGDLLGVDSGHQLLPDLRL